MSNRYREPSKDASYQVLIHLARWFQRRRFFRNQPIRNKNCMWRPCLLMDREKMSNLYRGPSIDASYHVSVHLAEGFQRRRLKCEKLTDDGHQVMAKAKKWGSVAEGQWLTRGTPVFVHQEREWLWVSDCCLMPNEQFFRYVMARTSYIQWDDDDNDVHFIPNQYA